MDTDVSYTTEVFRERMKLNPSRRCSLVSPQKTFLRGWLTEICTVQFSGNNSWEEPATETVTVTATVKNQKTSLWFMCYRFVWWIIVAQPSERSSKTKCQTSTHELLSRCPGNTWFFMSRSDYELTRVTYITKKTWQYGNHYFSSHDL
jgi:hypothetical protein